MLKNDLFLRACKREAVERIPVWYMRQAGRYDPDYRKIKEKFSLLEICRQPELAAEVTLMPVHKLGVDAAILYSDIMNPVASIGIDFDIVKDVGPVIHNPVRSAADVDKLKPIDVEGDLSHVLETIRILERELEVPLISFAGAPFTLASYIIEGRPTKSYIRTKAMMYGDSRTWHLLMGKLAEMAATYLRAHIASGAKRCSYSTAGSALWRRTILRSLCCLISKAFSRRWRIWMCLKSTSRASAPASCSNT